MLLGGRAGASGRRADSPSFAQCAARRIRSACPIGGLGALVFLFGLWRWLNDPPEMRREDGPIPALRAFLAERDAVLGLGLAVIVVLVILGLVTMAF